MRCRFFFLHQFAAIHLDTTGSFSTSGIKRPWAFLLCLRGVFVWRSLSSSRTQHFGWGGWLGRILLCLMNACCILCGWRSKGGVEGVRMAARWTCVLCVGVCMHVDARRVAANKAQGGAAPG
jgi:hypothetical protein